MDYRALLLVALMATPTSACADDAGTPPPPPEHDYSLCGRMRVEPDWCRDRQPTPPRARVRVRSEEPHR
jgi:hypothetical protein